MNKNHQVLAGPNPTHGLIQPSHVHLWSVVRISTVHGLYLGRSIDRIARV